MDVGMGMVTFYYCWAEGRGNGQTETRKDVLRGRGALWANWQDTGKGIRDRKMVDWRALCAV